MVIPRSVPSSQIRVTNADRDGAVERLGRALADGCLTASEFDERVASALAAVTRGDLARPVEDLPPDRPPVVRHVITPTHPALRAITKMWLFGCIVSIVLWGMVGFVRADLLPLWWLWFAGPTGAVLSTMWYVSDGAPSRRG